MNELDDRIFYYEDVPTTTNTTTKRIFNPTPPPPPDKKRFAILEFFRIMHIGMRDVEMLPSDMRKYESWTLNIKSAVIALFICASFMSVVFTTSIGSQPYDGEKVEKTYIDQLIDYFYNDNETPLQTSSTPNTVVVVKDTLVPMDSLQYLIYQNDSIIKAMNR
jgi:hypothetical protein